MTMTYGGLEGHMIEAQCKDKVGDDSMLWLTFVIKLAGKQSSRVRCRG